MTNPLDPLMKDLHDNSLTDKELKKKLTTILWYNFQDGCTVEDVHDAVDEVMALISDTVAKAEREARIDELRHLSKPENYTRYEDGQIAYHNNEAGISMRLILARLAELKPQQESEEL